MTAGQTTPEAAASQRELDQLRNDLRRIDDGGTRGVAAVQIQLTEAIKDIADLRGDMRAHEQVHERATAAQVTGRRWAVGATIAAGSMLIAMLGLLVDIAGHIH